MKKTLLEALAINAEKISTIAVVGGGGKTSLIFRLMESFVSIGKKVIVTTSRSGRLWRTEMLTEFGRICRDITIR